jgi:hypothetical protein
MVHIHCIYLLFKAHTFYITKKLSIKMANVETSEYTNLREAMQLMSSSCLHGQPRMGIVNVGPVLSKRYDGQQKLDTCNKQVYLDLHL